MADVLLNSGGKNYKRVLYTQVAASTVLSLNLGGATSVSAEYHDDTPATAALSGDMDTLHLKTNLGNSFTLSGVRFSRAGLDYVVKADGSVQTDPSPVTGIGTTVGELTPSIGELTLDSWAAGSSPVVSDWRAVAAAPINGAGTPFNTYGVTFRVPTAPIRPSSLSILGTMQDGTTFNVTADADGIINATRVKGVVNYQTGVVQIIGVTPSAPAGQSTSDISFLGITGVTNVYIDPIRQETVRFNAVAYTYLPLDAALLGINPVRLPSDGRVPIYRAGGVVVVGHKAGTSPATAANAGTVNCGRVRLSRVRVIGNNGATINTGYTVNLESGIVTWVDVTGYSQPVHVEHYVEDMAQVRDAQIDGRLVLLRPLTHDFPVGSYVSSALVAGDLRARTSLVFDQASWDGTTWLDALSGSAATATFNHAGFPITVTNSGALTERWAIKFTSTTAFQIIGEHVGVVDTGNINTVTAPLNPVNGEPYFTIPEGGWGTGWSIGNIVRINTVGAMSTVWLARTIQQGPESGDDYSFTVLVRGDIDNPI